MYYPRDCSVYFSESRLWLRTGKGDGALSARLFAGHVPCITAGVLENLYKPPKLGSRNADRLHLMPCPSHMCRSRSRQGKGAQRSSEKYILAKPPQEGHFLLLNILL